MSVDDYSKKGALVKERESLLLALQENRRSIKHTVIESNNAFPRSVLMQILTNSNASDIATKVSYMTIAISLMKTVFKGLKIAKIFINSENSNQKK